MIQMTTWTIFPHIFQKQLVRVSYHYSQHFDHVTGKQRNSFQTFILQSRFFPSHIAFAKSVTLVYT